MISFNVRLIYAYFPPPSPLPPPSPPSPLPYPPPIQKSDTTSVKYYFLTIAHPIGSIHDCVDQFCSSCSTERCTLTTNGATSSCCACRPNCDCKGLYLMNPTNNVSPNNPQFSPCSQTDICNKNQLFGTCLESTPVKELIGIHKLAPGAKTVLNGGICGNGLKDPNEECDCGGVAGCANNTCCFANCTLKAGAMCRYVAPCSNLTQI